MEFKYYALHNNITIKGKIKEEDSFLSLHGLKANLQAIKKYFYK